MSKFQPLCEVIERKVGGWEMDRLASLPYSGN